MALRRHGQHRPSSRSRAAPLGGVRSVLFDLGHTLVNRYANWAVIALSWPQGRLEPGPLHHRDVWSAIRRALARPIARLNDQAQHALRLSPGSLRLFAALPAAGIRVGIVTNGASYKRQTIRALGLPSFVGPVVSSSDRNGPAASRSAASSSGPRCARSSGRRASSSSAASPGSTSPAPAAPA